MSHFFTHFLASRSTGPARVITIKPLSYSITLTLRNGGSTASEWLIVNQEPVVPLLTEEDFPELYALADEAISDIDAGRTKIWR